MAEIVVREVQFPVTLFTIFQCLKGCPDIFFLDSALTKYEYSRYSFLGIEPFLKIKSLGSKIAVIDRSGVKECNGDPFDYLRNILNTYKFDVLKSIDEVNDIPFIGGAVGYFSYDMCHFIEEVPYTTIDDLNIPDMYFGFYDTIIAYDHIINKFYVISSNIDNKTDAEKKIKRLVNIVNRNINEKVSCKFGDSYKYKKESPSNLLSLDQNYNSETNGSLGLSDISDNYCIEEYINSTKVVPNFKKDGYLKAVEKAKEYIKAGDIYQVNLSQRFQTEINYPPFKLYERLRNINPAPYSSFIGFDGIYIVSSSPERFLSTKTIENRFNANRKIRAQIRPIKGTRPKYNHKLDDEKIINELLSSQKDDAELTMIVDLERNDLGRVCNFGSVKVVDRKVLESFATVHHLVSTIEGDLNVKYDIIDLIKATFPGGSITGAPKIRAMEIIDELEITKRSVYTGAIGYIGFDWNCDLSMAIRTLLVKDKNVYFQVGGAIVADSESTAEYKETLYKAFAMIKAINGI